MKTTRQGNPSVDPELQMVLYPGGEVVLFFHRINGEPSHSVLGDFPPRSRRRGAGRSCGSLAADR